MVLLILVLLSCARPLRVQASIRNQKGEARLRILYENKKLTVSLDTSNRRNWEECFSVENVYLPAG